MKTGSDGTLHNRILGDIEQRILSGEWPPGHRLPFEVDLAEQYGCSRMTANKVLTQLARAGMIERRKKSGSFVSQPVAQAAVLQIHDIEAEVRSLRQHYGYRLLSSGKRMATDEDRTRIDVPPDTEVLELNCMHEADGKPFCFEQRLISLTCVPEAEWEDFSQIAAGPWLVSRVPWNAAEHRIEAISATTELAKTLQLPKQAACLVIHRRTWGAEGPVTAVRLTYPGDRHTLVARFQPGEAERS